MIERNLSLKNVPRRLSSFAADGESRSVPKYELLKRALLDYISELPPEREFLPYEKELAGEFGVSRCTVTKALEKLRRGGYIETSKKSGSRIIRRSLPKPEEYREPMQNIAFLFANNEESTARTTDFRWQPTECGPSHTTCAKTTGRRGAIPKPSPPPSNSAASASPPSGPAGTTANSAGGGTCRLFRPAGSR